MALDVDEARGEDHPPQVDSSPGCGAPEHAPRRDPRDAVSPNGNVAPVPGRAGPIHQSSALEDQVVGTVGRRARRGLDRGELGGGLGGGGGIFDELFGGQRQDPTQPQRGEDLRYDLEIAFEEAAMGCEREISVNKPERCDVCAGSGVEAGSRTRSCPTCHGRGQVISSRGIFSIAQTCPQCQGAGRVERTTRKTIRIPAGVDTGTRLRSSGDGESGVRGGPAGDLFVVLHVKPHSFFQREGDDLVYDLPISFVQAALGAEIEAPSLNGKVTLRVPAGTQTGQLFRVKGKGIKNAQGYGWGDLHVRVNVEVPAHLNSIQRSKLQEFASLCDEKVNPMAQSFFEKAKNFFK